MQTDLAIDAADFAEVETQDVGVVDAGVDDDGAGVLHVPPGRDGDRVLATDARFDHQPGCADGTSGDQRPGEAVDRVASVVLAD